MRHNVSPQRFVGAWHPRPLELQRSPSYASELANTLSCPSSYISPLPSQIFGILPLAPTMGPPSSRVLLWGHRDLLGASACFKDGFRWYVANGRSVGICSHNWLGEHLRTYLSSAASTCRVVIALSVIFSSLILKLGHTSDTKLVLSCETYKKFILSGPSWDGDDTLIWNDTSFGNIIQSQATLGSLWLLPSSSKPTTLAICGNSFGVSTFPTNGNFCFGKSSTKACH